MTKKIMIMISTDANYIEGAQAQAILQLASGQ